jgi:hypothetical protein
VKTLRNLAPAASLSWWRRFASPTPRDVRALIAGAVLGFLVCATVGGFR